MVVGSPKIRPRACTRESSHALAPHAVALQRNVVRCMQRNMQRNMVRCLLGAASYTHLGILRKRSLPPRTALPLRYSLARALAIGLAPPPRTATHPAAHELRARARRLVQSGSDLRVKLALKGINLLDRHAALASEQHGPSSSSPVAHIGLSGGARRSFAAGSRREPAVTGRCDSCRRLT